MKILLTMNVPYTRAHGGANRSNRALIEALAARGHTVAVVTPALAAPSSITYDQWRANLAAEGVTIQGGETSDRFTLTGVTVVAVRDFKWMREELIATARWLRPDWILVASEDPSQTLLSTALDLCSQRVVYLALTPQLFPFGPESFYPGRERTDLVRRCALVCCLSQVTADYIHQHAGVPARVYRPPHFGAGPFPHFQNFDAGAVLLMNACGVKGLPIFLDLARAFPAVPFATLPGYATTNADRQALAACPNVALWPNEPALDDILRRTRVLLMPTLWMESFGLAAVDAMLRGIPVLASNHGALPEAKLGTELLLPVRPITAYRDTLGENLLPVPVIPAQDSEPWRTALDGLLTTAEVYRRHSTAARAAAVQFVAQCSVEPFERWLQEYQPETKTPVAMAPNPAKGTDLTPEQKALLILRFRQNATRQDVTRQETAKPVRTLQPVPRDGHLPLSFAQERLFFLDQLYPHSAIYNCPSALRLTGPLNITALRRALAALVQRHEVLRTTLVMRNGRGCQSITPEPALDVPLTDLSILAPAAREQRMYATLHDEAARPFSLAHGPLLRAILLRVEPEVHILALTLHHCVTDGWSTGILIRELGALYSAAGAGRPDPLPSLSLQYADYAVWQRTGMDERHLRHHLDYWTTALQGAPTLLALPTDRPRPAIQSHRGASIPFQVPADVASRLGEIARANTSTLFMTLFAAFTVLLHRLSGQDDLVIGTPVAGRTIQETEGMVGFFVNTLALRADLSGNPTFTELLRRVKAVTLDALAHQDLPFERLVEKLTPERARDHAPIFQVLFALQNAASTGVTLPGLRVEPIPLHSGTSKFDLNMELTETAEGLDGSVEYDSELFDPATVAHFVQAWQVVLANIAARPSERLGAYALLTEREVRATAAALTPPPRPLREGTAVVRLFQEQAARTPDAPAVYCSGQWLTYGQLERQANQLARFLVEAGVTTDTPVGLWGERSLAAVVGMLAILKAGGAYVPLDPSYPAERLDFMIAETATPVVLCPRHATARFAGRDVHVVVLDDAAAPYLSRSTSALDRHLPLESLAYIMYTSGSTGRPKGVQLSHRALVNLILWHLDKFPAPARILQFASLSFDASFHEIFASLAAGGSVYVIAEALRRDLPALRRFIREHGIEKVILPAVVLHLLCEQDLTDREGLQSLKEVICTGEQLKITPEVEAWFRTHPHASLHNDYGPTETHVVTSVRVSDHVGLWAPFPPIGLPIRNSRAYVLDRYLQPVPLGWVGEVYFAGDCLARGYHERPDLTADRFLPDVLSPLPGARMYRTGDLARIGRDGHLEYLGRSDHQVKIRGQRVELGEVEAVLRASPDVHDCLVVCREDHPGDKRLVAYLVATDRESQGGQPPRGEPPTTVMLRQHLATTLPDYMIPTAFVTLAQFPLTPNGKIDRVRLPAPDTDSRAGATEWQGPRTDIERQLLAIWTEILDRADQSSVGIHDNFFALGGHSILMIQVASRIHATWEVELPIQGFFAGPTIAEQAVTITELLAAQHGDDALDALLAEVEQLEDAEIQRLNENGATAYAASSLLDTPNGKEEVSSIVWQTFLRTGQAEQELPAITALGFPSSNQPHRLASAIRSYLDNVRQYEHRLAVVVCGDSRDAAMDRTYRELLATLRAKYDYPLWYAGTDDKLRYATELSREADVPPEMVQFALVDMAGDGKSYGVNRNALLLHLAGELFLSADDDTTAELYCPPDWQEGQRGVDFCTEPGVSEIRPVADREAALRLAHPVQLDLLAAHRGVLGASVAEVVARHNATRPPGFARTERNALSSLIDGYGTVAASYCGWVGESGWASPHDARFLDGQSWRWLTRSEEDYQQALKSWEQLRYVERLTLSRSGEFYIMSGGFDGRRILPPFLPRQRREDILFGLMLTRCDAHAYLAHLPTMVTHGRGDRALSHEREAVDFATFIELAVASWTPVVTQPGDAAAWESLGHHLEEVGGLPPADFAAWTRQELRRHLEHKLQPIEQRIADCPPERAFWAREMRQVVAFARRTLEDTTTIVPLGLAPGRSHAKVQSLTQRLLLTYGQLVRSWPRLLDAARSLRARGIRLARPLLPPDAEKERHASER